MRKEKGRERGCREEFSKSKSQSQSKIKSMRKRRSENMSTYLILKAVVCVNINGNFGPFYRNLHGQIR